MAKDYAKRIFTTTPPRKKKRWRVEFVLIAAVLVICLSVFGLYKYFGIEKLKSFVSHKGSHATQIAKKSSADQKDPDVHFEFYDQLPNMQVDVKPTTSTSTADVAKVQDNFAKPAKVQVAQYVLQLGIFKDQIGASQFRLSLLLSGCESNIVKIKTDEGDMFQVQRGPFGSESEAKKIQRVLQRKGVVGVVKPFNQG